MYYKHPRIYHLPWSTGLTTDDKRIPSLDMFKSEQVIATLKMDGENTSMYRDHIHARSLDSRHHVSRDWVKQFWSSLKSDIPENWRICGENLFAKHSIAYEDLKSYFYGFSIWNAENKCLSWDETLEWFNLLKIEPVQVLYEGIYDEVKLRELENSLNFEKDEGYVLALRREVGYEDFSQSRAKFVREKHVQTDSHWKTSEMIRNTLADENT